MIDIPLNKALVALEVKGGCIGCCWEGIGVNCDDFIRCSPCNRKDGKNIIFQLVDYPPDPSLKVMTEIINKFSDPPLTTEEVDALLKKMETGEEK